MRQRAAVKKRLDHLEILRPLPKMHELKAELQKVKERDRALAQEKAELEAEVEPTIRAINKRREYFSALDAVVKRKRENFAGLNQTGRDYSTEIDTAAEKVKDLGSMIEAERKTSAGHVADLKKLRQAVTRIERQMEEGEPVFDIASYNEKIVWIVVF